MSGTKADRAVEKDWAIEDDPLPDEMLERMRPMTEVMPDLVEAWRRARGAQKAPTKQLVSLRLDRDVVEHFRATGEGWQSRMNAALRKAAKL